MDPVPYSALHRGGYNGYTELVVTTGEFYRVEAGGVGGATKRYRQTPGRTAPPYPPSGSGLLPLKWELLWRLRGEYHHYRPERSVLHPPGAGRFAGSRYNGVLLRHRRPAAAGIAPHLRSAVAGGERTPPRPHHRQGSCRARSRGIGRPVPPETLPPRCAGAARAGVSRAPAPPLVLGPATVLLVGILASSMQGFRPSMRRWRSAGSSSPDLRRPASSDTSDASSRPG